MGASSLTSRIRGIRAARVACLLFATLAVPHPARADVRPALEVFLSGPPRAASAGRTYAGTFEWHAGVAMRVDSLRLSGERWRVTRFRPGPARDMRPGLAWRVAFRAVPADARRPLVLEWRADRRWYRKEFDLSPEAIARTRGPGGVSSHAPR